MLGKADSVSLKFSFCTVRRPSTPALHSCTVHTPPHTCAHVHTRHMHRHPMYTPPHTCTRARTLHAQTPHVHTAHRLSPCWPKPLQGGTLPMCLFTPPSSVPLKTTSVLFEEINSINHLLRIWKVWASFECVLLKSYFYNTRNSSILWALLTTQAIKRRSPFRQ